ncbi:MAG: hypothetical protein LBL57_07955 [Tannerella sp.]|jgi:tetratricopeptide (TPR) repeat protein|nr:hypothetical protein [Tannerella sp.]
MKKCFFILTFISFCFPVVFAQQTEWRDLIERKQFEAVIVQAAHLQPADSADFSTMYLLGQAYDGVLKYRNAYACYRQCYVLDSTRTDLLNALARVSINIGKANEAEICYQQILQYDSANFNANYQLGRLYVQLGKSTDAIGYYAYLLQRDTANPVLLKALGDCYTRMDSLSESIAYYYMAFENNKENAPLAVVLVNNLLTLYNPYFNNYADDAASVCDTALIHHPEDRTLRQKRAMIHYLKRDYQKADSLYSVLLSEQDSSYITLKYSGCARYYSRNWFNAIELLEKAFEKDTTAYDVCILLASALGRTYDPLKAITYFDKAEKLMEPDEFWSSTLMKYRAEIYMRTGDCKKGGTLYYQLWKNDTNNIVYLYNVQRCFALKNIPDTSEEDGQRFLFACYLYTSEAIRLDYRKNFKYQDELLRKFEEEMFFRGLKSLPMHSPDNKKNSLSIEKVKEMRSIIQERMKSYRDDSEQMESEEMD